MIPSPSPNRSAQILALHEDVQPAEYTLETDMCMIGRSSICQIVVQRVIVSRLHAKIERNGPRYLLHDIGSANGTFINSQRIHEPHLLADRDLIGLGAPTALLRFVDINATVVIPGQLRYDERAMIFLVGQQPIDLTPVQFRLLAHLYQHAGDVCTRQSCIRAIWSYDDPDLAADALDRGISSLQSKLRQIDSSADVIKVRHGLGYVLTL